MSPEEVRGLIADLVAKGAQPDKLSEPPAVHPPPVLSSADLAARIWDAAYEAVRTTPDLLQLPEVWTQKAQDDGATKQEAFGFWAIGLVGLVCVPFVGGGVRRLFSRYWPPVAEPNLAERLRAAIIRFLLALVTLATLGALFWAALLGVSSGRPIMEEVADRLVWGALEWQLSIALLLIIVSPQRPDLRPIGIDDADAQTIFRWLSVYLTTAR